MEYNKRTIFYRRERCHLEPDMEARIPTIGYKAKLLTDELMDDDAVKVMRAFISYADYRKEEDLKNDFLNDKVKTLISLRDAALEFKEKVKNIINGDNRKSY